MSLAIKFGKDGDEVSGFIYFDAVAAYTRNLNGKVTSHPIDAGGNISDHYIGENPTVNIKGIISGADISGYALRLMVEGDDTPLNANERPDIVEINELQQGLNRFIPDSVAQFINTSIPTVKVDNTKRTNYNELIYLMIEKLMVGLTYNKEQNKFNNNMSLVTLYTYDLMMLVGKDDDFVITSFVVDESPDSGSGMFFSMTLEKVRFSVLSKTAVPKDVQDKDKKKTTTTVKKGKVAEVKTVDNVPRKVAPVTISGNTNKIKELSKK